VASTARARLADDRAIALAPIVSRLDPDGTASYNALARLMTAEGVPTPGGAGQWSAAPWRASASAARPRAASSNRGRKGLRAFSASRSQRAGAHLRLQYPRVVGSCIAPPPCYSRDAAELPAAEGGIT